MTGTGLYACSEGYPGSSLEGWEEKQQIVSGIYRNREKRMSIFAERD